MSIFFPFAGPGSVWRWKVQGVLVLAVVGGLWHVNGFLDLPTKLHSPWPALNDAWLPLLFSLCYGVACVGYWLWSLLGLEHSSHEAYPDLDAAWAEAVSALEQAGIGVADLPLFLILGRPAAGDACLFEAAGLPLIVPQSPARADAPLRVFASRDAIYVTCPESSLLGQQASLFAEGAVRERLQPEAAPLAPMHAILARAQAQGRGPSGLTADERQEISRLVALGRNHPAVPASQPILLTDPQAMARGRARLEHVCRLIDKQRRPYCPINGLMLLVPWKCLSADAEMNHLAKLATVDLAAADRALQVECPCVVLVCDLETVPGFREFVERLSEPERRHSLGQALPLVPDVDPPEIQATLRKSIARIHEHILAATVLSRCEKDLTPDNDGPVPAALRKNIELYQLFAELRRGCQRLVRLIAQVQGSQADNLGTLAGCYLAATGSDGPREQAFVAGVFEEMLRNQNFVAWSSDALAQEASYRRLVRVGFAGLMGLMALVAWTLALVE